MGIVVSVDVGGTLGNAEGTSLASILAAASPLDSHEARRIMRHQLHTQPTITDTLIGTVCAALRIPAEVFPRTVKASPLALFPGVLESLRAMSEHALVVTLSNVTCVDVDTDQLNDMLSPWVSGHFPSCRTGFAKPDPRAFETTARACGSSAADMVHIGDDWECDIVGAVSVKATAIWISKGRPVPDEDLVIDAGVLVAPDMAAASSYVTDLIARRRS
jgi:FMN phosphatase YigB (HAD superfamily)